MRKESVLGATDAEEKVERIRVKNGAGANFLSQLPVTLPPRNDGMMVFLSISMVLWKWILFVSSWRLIHSYIYSGIIYAFG